LLTFATGGAPVRRTVALAELLPAAVAFALQGANVRSDLQIAAALWPVEADPGQLQQAIHNVVLNAAQAMPAGGTVDVRAENAQFRAHQSLSLPEGRYVHLTVQDYGEGIPPHELPHIFEPYFTTKPGGHGLGLATAYSIVTKHDGAITVDSAVGVGTTVSIYLPASAYPVPPVLESPALPRSGRILVMDDEAMIQELLREILTSLGYAVECVGDGTAAVAAYQQAQAAGQAFAAVILDLTIPGQMGGVETLVRLQALDPQVCAIVSSGYAQDPVLAHFAQYGFRAVIAKPYTVEGLHAVLQRVLGGQEPDC
jgi:two-component system cell cycle sensor histidine kinase/response regulator CckA